MELALVRSYDVVVAIHVIAVLIAFGPTFGYVVAQNVAERSYPRSIPSVMRTFTLTDRYLGTPGMLLILGAGIYMVADGPFELNDYWVQAGIGAIVVLMGLTHAFFIPSYRKLGELADRDIAAAGSGDVALSDDYWAVSRRLALVGTLGLLLILTIIFLMVVKP